MLNGYARNNMSAFVELQTEVRRFAENFTAVKRQREVGTGCFDAVTTTARGPGLYGGPQRARPRTNSSSTKAA